MRRQDTPNQETMRQTPATRNPKVAEGPAPSLSSGLRPLSASRTKDPFGDLSDPLVRGLAPDPVSWWRRWAR